jgi:hypothetical protein
MTLQSKDDLRNNAAALRIIHDELIAQRNAAQTREEWQDLNHAAKKAWEAWLKAQQALTMCSDEGAYSAEQKLS